MARRAWVGMAAILGLVAVAAGAFAAHGVEADARALLTTAGHYLLVHSVLATACGLWRDQRAATAGALALGGALVFSLSLSAIALLGLRWMGAVAPIGGVLMILGILGGRSPGFSNWTTGDAPFHGGALAIVSIFMIAGFSFQGTELVGVAAGEARNPRRDVPKAIHTVFWRIMIFYIGAITVVGFLVPYTDPNLLRSDTSDISYSPFTLVFERAGIGIAAAIMTAVILTAVLSAGNSGLYASTRMLWSLADEGTVPRVLARTNRFGVPAPAMAASMSGAVTGPRNWRATLPSGAIR
mgnify:CR=1 FL=1